MAFGEVKRAWLGFEVDADAGDIWGRSRGVAVSNVSPSSPAARAGISRGDRVMTADGRALRTQLDFESLMLDLTAGESLSLDIDGREEAVTLVAVELPSISADRVIALEQMELVTVTLEIRTERNLRYESGALIVAIERDLEGRIGLREGDVILQINRTAVASAEQAAQLLRQAAGNVAVYVERNGEVTVRQLVFRRSRG
jgi:serine protease Do